MLFHYVLAVLFVAQGCLARTDLRITDGDEAPPHQFPYLVSVVWSLPPVLTYRHMCGGVIITKDWILTSAHCLDDAPLFGKLGVFAGKHIINQVEEGEQFSALRHKVIHWKYEGGKGEHDIAMFKLATPLEFNSYVKAIALPKQDKAHYGDVVLAGWGSTSKQWFPKYPAVLQTATVSIVSNDRCADAMYSFGYDRKIFRTQLCTGEAGTSVSACSGDDGGPLVQYDDYGDVELVGIVSWEAYKCGSGKPTVYTRVSSYVDWINHKVNN